MQDVCIIYLVRHGETKLNAKGWVSGQADSELTRTGKSQALAVKKRFANIHFDRIYSSDTIKCTQTARIIAGEGAEIKTISQIRERNYGSFEGKSKEEMKKARVVAFERMNIKTEDEKWKTKFAPDVESDKEVADRVIGALKQIAILNKNKTVLVASSNGPIRCFLMAIGYVTKGSLPSGSIKNAGYIKVLSDGNSFEIAEIDAIQDSTLESANE